MTLMAMLIAVALIVFIIEAQVPLPIPGAKLGLANVVTLFALFYRRGAETSKNDLTTKDAFIILICRIILGAVFTGRVIAFIYSISGGVLAFAAQALMKKIVSDKQIWVCGSVGAIFHNIGQILAAILVTGTPSIVVLLPQLIIIGVITGVTTGYVAQFTIARLSLAKGKQ